MAHTTRKQEKALQKYGWWPALEGRKQRLQIRFWSLVVTTGVAAAAILNSEYGDQEHVFSLIQREYRRRMKEYFNVEGKGVK
mmetsp:Transcript_20266/g.46755  ORF Transcript_20266/g.46755 Transcript_20266/m.46755 type:complete len:82 (+) Transcript_20266:206-451(+)|eukprot:CAMPEP_0114142018 /NCGR_PEP_ID=MMETSP0043_2-20121206/18221_1 /TAXON_ID=464988 /ORGANISM="Hemiselmis andersenii, Strain CCMP644" /LENGTH=81 /DNA_ID=CAMNT_0001236205 /DNA_START=164 /DNA_END=409 /DNA_ORIENTATION=-